MSQLVPEKRLDKNGVLTTKHVRAMPTNTSLRKPLPMVDDTSVRALKAFDALRNHRGFMASYFVNEIQRELETRRTSHAVMERLILSLNPKTMTRLGQFSRTDASGITRNFSVGIAEQSFARINNFAVLRDDSDDLTDGEASMLIGGLNAHRGRSEFLDYGDATEDELVVPRAVIRAARTLENPFLSADPSSKAPSLYISSPLLVELIQDRPQDVDRIVAIVNERNPILDKAGVMGVAEILDAGTHVAVLDGTL